MRVETMWKYTLLLVCLGGCCLAGPLHGVKRNVPIVLREEEAEAERPAPEPIAPEYHDVPSTLTLPSNATSIRNDISDNFSCDDKVYGYYADVENDCQIFHVCLPVTYADGKENTFRWSFICPEETVFSQDSFTCLRREDMAITCEESVNYYELNSNFGTTDEQNANSNNVQPSEEQAKPQQVAVAASAQEEVQQSAAPLEEAPTPAAVPVPSQAKPVKEKPVKVQKPNRRKPQPKPQQFQTIYPTNKLSSMVPLRKMPNAGPKMPVSVPVSVPAEIGAVQEVEDEVKPVPPRYKKRPAVAYNTEKEVVEVPAPPFKVEMVHTLSNSESFKRKRPTFSHKQNVVSTKLPENVPIVVSVPEAVAVETVVPAVNLESNVDEIPVPLKEKTEESYEPVAQAAEETPIFIEPIQTSDDVEPQPSETEEHIVEPENVLNTINTQEIVPENEAAPVEYVAPVVVEKTKSEEPLVEEVQKLEDPIETETAPIVQAQNEETAAEKATLPESANSQFSDEAEKEQPFEVNDQLAGASEPVALDAVPEIVAPIENSEESVAPLPSLEELEEQKPADAIETMQATPEMERQDPLVQQAFAEDNGHLNTVGGFKPVDPEMAAEAEALISDFINALKSGHPLQEPNPPAPVMEETPAISAESEDAKVVAEETLQAGGAEAAEGKPEKAQIAPEVNENSLKSVADEEPVVAEVENTPFVSETEPVAEEGDKVSPHLKFPISNSFPANMYHIPVTVIHTPYEKVQNTQTDVQTPQQIITEEMKVEEAQVEKEAPAEKENVKLLPADNSNAQTAAEDTEELNADVMPTVNGQPPVAEAVDIQSENVVNQSEPEQSKIVDSNPEASQPATPMAFRPISIDDIVELVKERLDQVPANEKGAPMELVMAPGNAGKPVELKFNLDKGSAAQEEPTKQQTPADDIIFPIYHRVSGAEYNDIKAPETVAVEEPNVVVTDLKNLPIETEGTQDVAASVVEKALDQGADVKTNLANTAIKTETETNAATADNVAIAAAADTPNENATAELTKTNRALRSRSLTKAKLDPRKRRFLFRADAS